MLQSRFTDHVDEIFNKAALTKVALAVSGGCDSIALMYLMYEWAKGKNISPIIFVVDHNLREKSAHEAEFVYKTAVSLGMNCYKFLWHNSNSGKSAIQERAREGRYHLMTEKCHELGINTLLTAHHYDDLIENYVMRRRKKSGVFGLSYSSRFFNNNIQIIRPLLAFTKMELKNYLVSNKISWMEDDSNESDLYERNRVRKLLSNYSDSQKNELIAEIELNNRKAQKLNENLISFMANFVKIYNEGFAIINLNEYKTQVQDIKIQVLGYLLTIVGGGNTPPRYRNLEKILGEIKNNIIFHRSLHNCIIKIWDGKLLIFKEKAGISSCSVSGKTNSLLWDNRFIIEYSDLNSGYHITNLETDDYIKIKKEINCDNLKKISGTNHKLILFTLPVIKKLEKIVAIPHISYYDKSKITEGVKVFFRPAFISRFTHFL